VAEPGGNWSTTPTTEDTTMLRTARLAVATAMLMACATTIARDDVGTYPLADVLGNPEYAKRLEGVQFFFGTQAHPAIERTVGEFQSNKKTNAVGKSDKEACEWAFLSALLSFHQRALSEGADAVVNITGYYKKQPFSSETHFQCGAGATMAGVTLKGTVVKLK
jgi:uncharacterized protein YbjQ (UPF0145 family)